MSDRIKALQTTSQHRPLGSSIRPTAGQSPDLAKRANPFVRRYAEGKSSDTATSLSNDDQGILSPVPHRRSTLLYTDSKHDDLRLHHFEPAKNDSPASIQQSQPTRQGSSKRRTTCTRHGRRLKQKKPSGPTIEGMDRSLRGAYIPSGRRLRRQVDPASPYYFLESALTKTEGTSLSPEPCPDCVAEDVIRQREELARENDAQDGPVMSVAADDVEEYRRTAVPRQASEASTSIEISSTKTEPGTPIQDSVTGPTLVGTAQDHQTVLLPGTSVPQFAEAGGSSFIAADLGDMIDAIIIEHRGSLNHVITNLRQGIPNFDRVQRISRELALVSQSL